MRNKYLYLFAAAFGAAALLSGCTKSAKKDDVVDNSTVIEDEHENDERYKIYLLAKNSGYEGTYEEWLASIKGENGQNGDQVELRVNEGNIEWKYKNDTTWISLIALSQLVGGQGNPGVDGREVELSTNSTHILWRYEGDSDWNNLLELSSIIGEKGQDGDQIELRVNDGNIEWKYKNDTTWTSLISLSELKGENGSDGKEVEISANTTHIIWRYKGDTEWTNLLELSLLSGQEGKSAYDIAVEAGFKGTKDEWLDSLHGRGIVEIKKTSTEGNVDTYTIYYTDGTTFDFNVTNGVTSDDEVSEALYGFGFTEILGYGYSITTTYDLGKLVIIPEQYKSKDVIQIGVGAIVSTNVEEIVIPETIKNLQIQSILTPNLKSVFYDGDPASWKELNIDSYNPFGGLKFDVYFADTNGDVIRNGKRYSKNSEGEISTIDDINNISDFDAIERLTINPKNLYGEKLDLSVFTNLEEIYFDGDIEDWYKLLLEKPTTAKSLYVLDPNGSVTYMNKNYTLVTDYVIPNNIYAYYITNYIIGDVDKVSVTFNENFNNFALTLLSSLNEYYVYVNDVYENIPTAVIKDANKTYLQDNYGDVEHNGKHYTLLSDFKVELPDIADATNKKLEWNKVTFEAASKEYKTGDSLDIWGLYGKKSIIEFTGGVYQNPIDGITYTDGDILPTWKSFSEMLKTDINDGTILSTNNDDSSLYTRFRTEISDGSIQDKNGNITDIFLNTTSNINELGDENLMLDLLPYINYNKMPGLAQFLSQNPQVLNQCMHNGHLYYTPYFDGYQAPERGYVMDTKQVAKLLDDDIPEGCGNLISGVLNDGTYKTIVGEPKIKPFMNLEYNYPDEKTEIQIVLPDGSDKVTVTVNRTNNIIAEQTKLLGNTDSACTGYALIKQFKDYARAAYGDIIDKYYGGKISKMFTSVSACYNADDLVALLRIFKANPDVLYGSVDKYDAVVPVFDRGGKNRTQNVLQFAATLYGVQGFGSEYGTLFIGADGKLHDATTQSSSYELLTRLSELYGEGLIENNFYCLNNNEGFERYFAKTKPNSTFGLIEYDYFATQCAANDKYNGIGTTSSKRSLSPSGFNFSEIEINGIMPILSPLTYVSNQTYDFTQSLDDFYGKSLCRYYEENRGLKANAWGITKFSDNIDSAIALLDSMYTLEGSNLINYGPDDYYEISGQNTPVIKQDVYDCIRDLNKDFWAYYREYIGSTAPVGHIRYVALDYQATNSYGQEGYANVLKACDLNVQLNSRDNVLDNLSWNSSVPINLYPAISYDNANTFANLNAYWSFTGTNYTSGNPTGWVATIVNSSYLDTSIQSKELINKLAYYVYPYGNAINATSFEAKLANEVIDYFE